MLPSPEATKVLTWASRAAPQKASRWFHTASAPSAGIGNEMPPAAPCTPVAMPVGAGPARVALRATASYTDCGKAAVRRLAKIRMR